MFLDDDSKWEVNAIRAPGAEDFDIAIDEILRDSIKYSFDYSDIHSDTIVEYRYNSNLDKSLNETYSDDTANYLHGVSMKDLLCTAGNLRKGDLKKIVDKRLDEFRELGKKGKNEIFKEMCFCLLTANYSAEGGIRIQKEIGDGFVHLPQNLLSAKLREMGHSDIIKLKMVIYL